MCKSCQPDIVTLSKSCKGYISVVHPYKEQVSFWKQEME